MYKSLLSFLLFSRLAIPIIQNEEPAPLYMSGDQPAWAAKDYNDSSWRKERGQTGTQIFWSRTRLNIREVDENLHPLGISVDAFGAFDLYWDGVLLGHNGQLPTKGKPEIPGTENSIYQLPDSLTSPGIHVVSMRSTQSFHADMQRSIGFKIDKYTRLLSGPLINMSYMNLMAGAFLIAAVYYFFLYLNSKRRQLDILIFATSCLLFFGLLIMEYLKFHVFIPYNHFFIRLEIIGWLTFANALLIPWYFIRQFHFKKGSWLLFALALTLLFLYIFNYGHYDLTARLYSLVMLIAAFIVVVTGIFRKEKGGVIVFGGLVISSLVNWYVVYDYGLFITFTIIVLCMLYLHSIRTATIEEERQEAVLLSSRLKLELLKKNIQPHFLRNTLTSMIDWVEESPKEGARFIHALAAEFEIMNEISEMSLIPLTKELELCRQHLAVMGFRKEVDYVWQQTALDETQLIPPAILHTLLENGITHSIPLPGNTVKFKLSYYSSEQYHQYTFETMAGNREAMTDRKGGTGFAYVKARLTESYGQKWTFHTGATNSGWSSVIKISHQ